MLFIRSTLRTVELREALDRIERLQREREALDGSYADLKAQIDSAYAPVDAAERERRLGALLKRLATYVDMERRQSRVSYELAMDAYQRLVQASDD
jgi:phage host-nuclease inhibitor protein Gam